MEPNRTWRDPYALAFLALLAIAGAIGIALSVRALQVDATAPPSKSATAPARVDENPLSSLAVQLQEALREMGARLRERVALMERPDVRIKKEAARQRPAPESADSPANIYPVIAANAIPAGPHVTPVPARAY